ncbi:MAG: hypothetical protein RQ899_01475 [Pseudomonadales bacterium]|nr:hypothetical protein [Pseudomonadales bacterium]
MPFRISDGFYAVLSDSLREKKKEEKKNKNIIKNEGCSDYAHPVIPMQAEIQEAWQYSRTSPFFWNAERCRSGVFRAQSMEPTMKKRHQVFPARKPDTVKLRLYQTTTKNETGDKK